MRPPLSVWPRHGLQTLPCILAEDAVGCYHVLILWVILLLWVLCAIWYADLLEPVPVPTTHPGESAGTPGDL